MNHDPYSLSRPDSLSTHVWAAVCAGLFSVLAHAALVLFMENVPIGAWNARKEQEERMKNRTDLSSRIYPGIDLSLPADPLPKSVIGESADSPRPSTELADVALPPDPGFTALPDAPDPVHEMIPPSPGSAPEDAPPSSRPPRQEILEIVDRRIDDSLAVLPRWNTPSIERTDNAPDYVPPVDFTSGRLKANDAPPSPGPLAGVPAPWTPAPPPVPEIADIGSAELETANVAEKFAPPPETEVSPRPIERYLKAEVLLLRTSRKDEGMYFEIRIDRVSETVLPVTPKDLFIIQDSSASLAEERLFFCRRGWQEAVKLLNPDDRFNIISFRNDAEYCFPDLAEVNEANLETASRFLSSLRSMGGTDLYGSLDELLRFRVDAERPAIALIVTDGHPTLGVTHSSDIIGQFTRDNDGNVSVFTLGTQKTANVYLLDMLAFGNRGRGHIVQGGRWNIDKEIVEKTRQINRPLLNNVRYRFDAESNAEIYPSQSMNLYEDQPLILYGRCPENTTRLVFQIRGVARDVQCDMIFDVDLQRAEVVRNRDLRLNWARLKLYELVMSYAGDRDPDVLDQMRRVSSSYGIPIPYRNEF